MTSMSKRYRIGRLALLLGVLATVAVFAYLAGRWAEITPQSVTRTRMTMAEQRIRKYVAAHRRLPKRLSDLPPLESDRDGSLADGWGRQIQYTKEGQTVTLLSLGKDGHPGGIGDDVDIRVTFAVASRSSQPRTHKEDTDE